MKEGVRNMNENKIMILSGNSIEKTGNQRPIELSDSYFLSDNYEFGSGKHITLADGTELNPQKFSGYYALQDKETNELHCISLYPYNGYSNTFSTQQVSYFDTSDMKEYVSQTWNGQGIEYIESSLKTRFRKNLSNYNLVLIVYITDFGGLPYATIQDETWHVKYMGPSPLSRDLVDKIKQIYVLTKDINEPTKLVELKSEIKELEIKVI